MILQYDKKVHGEFESLKTLRETKTVLTPRPITYGHTKEKNVIHFIALEFMNFTMVDEVLPDSALELLGSQIADLHMYNWEHSCSLVSNRFYLEIFTLIVIFFKSKYDGAIRTITVVFFELMGVYNNN